MMGLRNRPPRYHAFLAYRHVVWQYPHLRYFFLSISRSSLTFSGTPSSTGTSEYAIVKAKELFVDEQVPYNSWRKITGQYLFKRMM